MAAELIFWATFGSTEYGLKGKGLAYIPCCSNWMLLG
jgi:hypothetical protein